MTTTAKLATVLHTQYVAAHEDDRWLVLDIARDMAIEFGIRNTADDLAADRFLRLVTGE